MIGKLSGRIDYRGEDHVLLDVRGRHVLLQHTSGAFSNAASPGSVCARRTSHSTPFSLFLLRLHRAIFFF